MSDVNPATSLPAGGAGEGASRLSYAFFTSWCRQRLLPTLFPSPATATMSPPRIASLCPAALPDLEVTAAAKVSVPPTPPHSAAVPTQAAFLATPRGERRRELAPLSPPPHSISIEMEANSTDSVPAAALVHSLSLPPAAPQQGCGVASSKTSAVATDSCALADASPTQGSASSVSTTPQVTPSSSLLSLHKLSTKAASTSNAASDKPAPVLLAGNGRPGLPSSTSSPFIYPAPLSSPFPAPADSLAGMRTPPTCVELPGPQSLFIRGSDALGCSGRSPPLL
ncbi:hypothetical protein CGC21_37390 [Leishmania donovani]|uniref:Uncharacterized protein n=1 Tax=Leishmania donovani TaxID=5661 RepID=A0A504Y7X3_LEIDO|nr:hypothetical protein CGC21_37390 [Leishmania donovani]